MATKHASSIEKQASEIWKYLDNLSETNPEEYKIFIKKTLEEGKEELKQPEPFLSFKTHKIPKTVPYKVVYVNVCSYQKLDQKRSELKCSKSREEIVESRKAIMYDVYMCPSVIEKHHDSHKELCMLALHSIEYSESIKLNKTFEICKEKYIGNRDCLLDSILPDSLRELTSNKTKRNDDILIHNQHLDDDYEDEIDLLKNNETTKNTKKLIEEISSTVYKEELNSGKALTPTYTVTYDNKYMTTIIDVKGVESIKKCIIDIDQDQIHFESIKKYKLDIKLSQKINIDTARAYFIKDSSNLLIKAEVLNSSG